MISNLKKFTREVICAMRGHMWLELGLVICTPPNTHKVDRRYTRCDKTETVFKGTREQWREAYLNDLKEKQNV